METLSNSNSILFYEMIYKCGKSAQCDHLNPVELDHRNPEQTDQVNPVQIDHPISCI